MSSSAAVYFAVFGAICDVAGVVAIVAWMAGRRRAASEIVRMAEQHAGDLRQQGAREAESLKKEAQLEAREKAHALLADTESQARARQQEIAGLDRSLAERTHALAERTAASEALERGLRTREAA